MPMKRESVCRGFIVEDAEPRRRHKDRCETHAQARPQNRPMKALIPSNETERLTALHRLNILDTSAEQAYDDLAKLAWTL